MKDKSKSQTSFPLKYTGVFERSEDGGYTVTVPALPGLVTEGDNLKKARAMAKDAVQCYIESLVIDSMPIPPDQPVIKRRSDMVVGKIVLSPQTYKDQDSAPVGISDPKLFLKLYLIKKCLDALFDDKSRKKERIKSLKDLLTLCDSDLRELISQEIERQLKPSFLKQPKSLTDLQKEAKKRGLDSMTDREIDAEVRRIRKALRRAK